MPEKLSLGRQEVVEPLREALIHPPWRGGEARPAEALAVDGVEVSALSRAVLADAPRLTALALAVERGSYAVPAEALSRTLVEAHLAADAEPAVES